MTSWYKILGLKITSKRTVISVALSVNIRSRIEAEMRTLELALAWSSSEGLNVGKVLISCSELWRRIEGDGLPNATFAWLDQQMRLTNIPRVDLILWSWNRNAAALAGYGANTIQMSLFHQGMD